MRAFYSVLNMAWIVVFGDSIQEIHHRRFWPTKDELKYDLRMCGLKLGKGNKIALMGDTCSYCGASLPDGGGYKTCAICGTPTGCS